MYVVELKNGEWICSESKKRIRARIATITGRSDSGDEPIENLWYQPWNYLSGVMSDFFWTIKDGKYLEREIPMREWHNELPLTKCITGGVTFLGKKEPIWYRKLLVDNIIHYGGHYTTPDSD